jgi:hypothetical protein
MIDMLISVTRLVFAFWVAGVISLTLLSLSDGFFGEASLKLTIKRFFLALIWPLLFLSSGGLKVFLSRFASVF